MENKKYSRNIRHLLAAPFIWVPLLALFIVDIFLEIYHRICFPLYGLSYIKRRKYIRIDRQKLQYLNSMDKFSCMYCGYANGWLHYASVIAAETEKYFCGIKHKKGDGFIEPQHHGEFVEYDNEDEYEKKYFSR